ncbi:MAG: WG repeat-containing protein [Clostridiales bacterium]|nr:WG repeat-containing protein [Clostridiales bacterium]
MNILKKIAVRVIPVGVLAFIITATIAYQRGVYDITFIERPQSSTAADSSNPVTDPPSDELQSTDPADTGENSALPPDDTSNNNDNPQIKTDSVSELLNQMESTKSVVSRGYNITDGEYGIGMKLTLLDPSIGISNSFSLRNKQIDVAVRIPDEVYSGYTTVTETQTVKRPLVEIYMDYILVDNGSSVIVLDKSGNVIARGFDIERYQPAYTRDKNDIALFKETDQKGVTKYYYFNEGNEFIESDYNDAADNRGLYINYPSYFGKTDNSYHRFYNQNSGFYGYGNANGSMRTAYRYTQAYNYSEGLAAVVDSNGILTYIQQWFYNQLSGTRNYRDQFNRYVTSNYLPPDSHGIETLGFYYFDHGLCRVRKRIVDNYKNERIMSDKDIIIRRDGTEFEVPSDYEVLSYSCGMILLKKDSNYGYIDYTGKWIVQPEYDYAEPYNEGLAVVGKNGSYGLVDKDGNFVIPMIFDYVQSCSGGIIAAWDNDNGWAIFNKVN